jgi:tetratricopeptide (TPR) repeat protein
MKTLLFVFTILICASCDSNHTITDPRDYDKYLSYSMSTSIDPVVKEMKFWSDRLKENARDEIAMSKVAGLYAARFKISGDVRDLQLSDSLYQSMLKTKAAGSVEIYHSLATNAITQHKFPLAKDYIEKAIALKDKKAASLMILTDVSLEIGDYATARRTLQQFKNKNSFAYLVREVKLKDHEGDLESAITSMERAYNRIKGNEEQAQWALSNLADMYGHAGRLEDAYETYLKALEINPKDDYSLKGIAWIALSYDHNTRESKRIINILASRKKMPELHLLLAEVASFEGNEHEKIAQLKMFKSLVSRPAYKNMYYKYLAVIEAEDFNDPGATVEIAKAEIANRPTPQSFDLLAWGLYHQGKYSQALDVASRNVEGQTFEPDAYYHLGMIYLANGDRRKSKQYLEAALKSEFELGPSLTREIVNTLNDL